MKKYEHILLVAMSIVTLFSAFVAPRTYAQEGGDPLAILIGELEGDGPILRAYSGTSVQVSYQKMFETVIVTVLSNTENASVEIENTSNGAVWRSDLDPTFGIIPVTLFGETGLYRVQLDLPDGRTYTGSFVVE